MEKKVYSILMRIKYHYQLDKNKLKQNYHNIYKRVKKKKKSCSSIKKPGANLKRI